MKYIKATTRGTKLEKMSMNANRATPKKMTASQMKASAAKCAGKGMWK